MTDTPLGAVKTTRKRSKAPPRQKSTPKFQSAINKMKKIQEARQAKLLLENQVQIQANDETDCLGQSSQPDVAFPTRSNKPSNPSGKETMPDSSSNVLHEQLPTSPRCNASVPPEEQKNASNGTKESGPLKESPLLQRSSQSKANWLRQDETARGQRADVLSGLFSSEPLEANENSVNIDVLLQHLESQDALVNQKTHLPPHSSNHLLLGQSEPLFATEKLDSCSTARSAQTDAVPASMLTASRGLLLQLQVSESTVAATHYCSNGIQDEEMPSGSSKSKAIATKILKAKHDTKADSEKKERKATKKSKTADTGAEKEGKLKVTQSGKGTTKVNEATRKSSLHVKQIQVSKSDGAPSEKSFNGSIVPRFGKASFKVPIKASSQSSQSSKSSTDAEPKLLSAVPEMAKPNKQLPLSAPTEQQLLGPQIAELEDSDFESLSNTQDLTFDEDMSSISQNMELDQDPDRDFVSLEAVDCSQPFNMEV